MRGIRGQFIHPGLFETDIADAQVGGAFIQIDQLLGGRVVGFGAASFRNHADYLEFIACNGFCEIAQRFQGDSQGRFCGSGLFTVTGGKQAHYQYHAARTKDTFAGMQWEKYVMSGSHECYLFCLTTTNIRKLLINRVQILPKLLN